MELAQGSTVIFNAIDYGEYFDYAVCSLSTALGLPYVSANSYAHSAVVECYPPPLTPKSGPCWACNNAPADKTVLSRLTPDIITQFSSLDFLPKVHVRTL